MGPTSQENSSFGSLGANGGGGFDANVGANVDANMNYNVPTSTGTGDIIIEGDKKSKKGLIVGLALLVGVIVVGGMVAAIIFLGQKGESVRDKFNKLINYVVSGEESLANYTGTYNNDTTYYFDEQQKDINNRPALYVKTSELLDDFVNAYNKLENKEKFSSDAERFERIIDNERKILDLVKIVGVKKIPTIYDAIDVYLKKGKNGGIDQLTNYYDSFTIENNDYSDDFVEAFKALASSQIDIAEIYSNSGCLSGNTIKINCIDSSGDNDILRNYNDKIGKMKKALTDVEYYYNLGDFFTIWLFDSSGLLSKEDVMSEEEAIYV